MDERQELNAGRASMIVLGVIALIALGVLAWEYITTKDVTNGWAIATLLGSGALLALLMRTMGGPEAPRTLLGTELPTGSSAAEKAERRKWYLIDSVAFSAAVSAISVVGLLMGDPDALDLPQFLRGTIGAVGAGIVSFVVGFGVYYLITMLTGEEKSRAVERRLARLEAQ